MENSFLTTVALAMQIINDFKLVITKSNNQAFLGTAFTQGGTAKKHSKARLTDAEWNLLTPEAKSKLIEIQKAAKAAKATATGKTAKSLDNRTMMIVPWDLLKAWQI